MTGHRRVWAALEGLVADGTVAAVAMPQLIARGREEWPGQIWDTVAQLAFDEEAALAGWLHSVLAENPPGQPLNGLWFGLFMPARPDGCCHALYVGGTAHRDDADAEMRWVGSLSWLPEVSTAPLAALAALPTGLDEEDAPNEEQPAVLAAVWLLPIAYAALLVRNVVPALARSGWAEPEVEVAVGYDSGDLLRVGVIASSGFTPARLPG